MRKPIAFLLFLAVFLNGARAQTNAGRRPKIGLTLSGGGAKGLAHIGILKAIDSAGLPIDYVTGTSMGSIIGSLYATGYSADSIEQIARKIDWDVLLSNQTPLRNIIMEEKSEYSKYDLELPWVNHWFHLATGVLEGQELWLKFAELLFPAHNVKDFHKLPIPFACIATDIATGEAVVLDSGELVSCVRASMAIPSLFTAVDYDGKKLVDGGVVRNFPVRDVRAMGADFVIGSNVSNGLLKTDKVNNALQVLLQVAFFREAEDTRTEVPLCDIYVQTPLDKFGMAAFGGSQDIVQAGIEEGRRLYPRLKRLADSLEAIYGPPPPRRSLVGSDSVRISSYQVNGLVRSTPDFFIHTTGLLTGKRYSSAGLSRMVRRAVGTRYYNRIVYSLQPLGDGSTRIVFDVEENPLTFAKVSLHYNQFSGIGAILNLTSRDFLTPNSRTLGSVNIGESFRVRGEHLQYFGRGRKVAADLLTQFDQFRITSYADRHEAGLYTRGYFTVDGRLGYSTNRNLTVGLGTRFDWYRFAPSITSSIAFRGTNDFFNPYVYLRGNTLDRAVNPRRGFRVELEAGWVARQRPSIQVDQNNRTTDTTTGTHPYARAVFQFEGYTPISRRAVFVSQVQSGVDFDYRNNIMNEFSLGGLTPSFRNQITFAGLREGSFYTPSLAALQAGIRYQLFSNTYLTGRANVLFANIVTKSVFFNTPDFLSGYSLTFSYNFALGPLEVSAMYCDQWKRVLGYVNIGIPF